MRELLFSVTKKDLRIDTFRAGGKGGQHQNKTDSAARVTHIASGAVGESREEREQAQNIRIAFRRMAESDRFKQWHKMEVARVTGALAAAEARVEEAMRPKNLRLERRDDDGRWVEWDGS